MKKISLFLFIFTGWVSLYSQQIFIRDVQVRDVNDVNRSNSPYPSIEFDNLNSASYPGTTLKLCGTVYLVNQDTTTPIHLGVDEMRFEIFKYRAVANPLDPSSTPPYRTIPIYTGLPDADIPPSGSTSAVVCTTWSGDYSIEGFWGKSNGFFGFRVTAKTNRVSPTLGNVNIETTVSYPGENQYPIKVDVVNIHVVNATPTVVGKITGVGAQPYNILYRLSKDATVTITVEDADGNPIRTIVNQSPRFGEGIPDKALTNGDFWDGRDDSGLLVPASNYYYRINASAHDDNGWDEASEYKDNISIDPLQITDIAIKDLGPLATDVAIISYQLTEDATVYLDIYPPGTSFSNGINCAARSTSCSPSSQPVRSIISAMPRRQTLNMYWDGKDQNGNYLCDGQYIFALSAVTKGRGGDIWTKKLGVGTVSISKGNPLAFLNPSSTILGSTPPAAGLNPFYFRYQLQRPSLVRLEIRDMNNNIIRTIVNNESRSSGLVNMEVWDGKNDQGLWVSSGTYRVSLKITDPYVCMQNNVFTHDASIDVNLFRIVDVAPSHIIGVSTQASISYTLSQSMWTEVKIYRPDVVINPSEWPWNSGDYIDPAKIVYSISGTRPGRFKITEFWDGRGKDGYLVEDGRYPFTIVAYSSGSQNMYSIDKAYGYIDVARGPIMFLSFNVTPTIADMKNSSDVIKLPPYLIEYSLTRQSSVTITINDFNSNQVVARIVSGETRDPFVNYRDFWDGKCYRGVGCIDGQWMVGTYNVWVYAQDVLANPNSKIVVTTVATTIDNFPLRLYDLAIGPLTPDSPAVISYQVSEPMKVAIKIYKPGTKFVNDVPVGCGAGEVGCLVNKIVGVRPARTLIQEYWDGKDMTGSQVPSGNYVFKIFASTDTTEINSITGDCPSGGCNSLAHDILVQDLPVMQAYVEDPCKYFRENSYFAPNPFNTDTGNFRVAVPMLGNVEVRVYNLNGEKVYSYDSRYNPQWAGGIAIDSEGQCISGSTDFKGGVTCKADPLLKWNKTNLSGKILAPGLYIAVFKFTSTQGTKELCQFRKKIIIP